MAMYFSLTISICTRILDACSKSLRGTLEINKRIMDACFKSLRGTLGINYKSLRGTLGINKGIMDACFKSFRGTFQIQKVATYDIQTQSPSSHEGHIRVKHSSSRTSKSLIHQQQQNYSVRVCLCVDMWMCACVCVWMCVWVWLCGCVHGVCVFECGLVWCVYMCCMHTHTCVCMCVHMCACLHVFMVCTYMHVCVCKYVYAYNAHVCEHLYRLHIKPNIASHHWTTGSPHWYPLHWQWFSGSWAEGRTPVPAQRQCLGGWCCHCKASQCGSPWGSPARSDWSCKTCSSSTLKCFVHVHQSV